MIITSNFSVYIEKDIKHLAILMMVSALAFVSVNIEANPLSGSSVIQEEDWFKDKSKETSNASINVDWKLWTLLEEPVDLATASWSFKNKEAKLSYPVEPWANILIPVNNSSKSINITECRGDNDFRHSGVFLGYCVPEKVIRNISITELLVDVKFESWNSGTRKVYTYTFDVGVMSRPSFNGQAGKRSFNIAGSKDWKSSFIDDHGRFHTKSSSKEFFRLDAKVIGINIKSIKYDFTSIISYLVNKIRDDRMTTLKDIDDREFDIQSSTPKEEFDYDPLGDLEDEVYEDHIEDNSAKQIEEEYGDIDRYLNDEMYQKRKEITATKSRVDKRFLLTNKLSRVRNAATDLYGYSLESGKIVIPQKFKSAKPFHNNLAAVNNGKKWGFIDIKGRLVIGYKYDKVLKELKDGVIIVENFTRHKSESHTVYRSYCGRSKKRVTVYNGYDHFKILKLDRKGRVLSTTTRKQHTGSSGDGLVLCSSK